MHIAFQEIGKYKNIYDRLIFSEQTEQTFMKCHLVLKLDVI